MEVLHSVYFRPVKIYGSKSKIPKHCIVYGWFRLTRGYLYIGSSVQGFARFCSHETIGKVEPVYKHDELHVWYTNKQEMRKLEYELTNNLNPFYQTREGNAKRGVFGYGNNGLVNKWLSANKIYASKGQIK